MGAFVTKAKVSFQREDIPVLIEELRRGKGLAFWLGNRRSRILNGSHSEGNCGGGDRSRDFCLLEVGSSYPERVMMGRSRRLCCR